MIASVDVTVASLGQVRLIAVEFGVLVQFLGA
jgi:hypothetical protein